MAKALADQELVQDVGRCAIAHPSINLEKRIFDSDPLPVVEAIRRPVLFMPAGNDEDGYRENGDYLKALKKNNPDSATIDFPDMTHGWSIRGM